MKTIIITLLSICASIAHAGMHKISVVTNLYGLEETTIEFLTSNEFIQTIIESENGEKFYNLQIEIIETEKEGEIKLITSFSSRVTEEKQWIGFTELEAILTRGNGATIYKKNSEHFTISLK